MTLPAIGSFWQHENGNEYVVYDITNEHADPQNRDKYPIVVSYVGMNGRKWSKPLENFLAKMKLIPEELVQQKLRDLIRKSSRTDTLQEESKPYSDSLLSAVRLREPNDLARQIRESDILIPSVVMTNDREFKPTRVGRYYFCAVSDDLLDMLKTNIDQQPFRTNLQLNQFLPYKRITQAQQDEIYDRGVNCIREVMPGVLHCGSNILSNHKLVLHYAAIASTLQWVLIAAKYQPSNQRRFNVMAESRFRDMEHYLRSRFGLSPLLSATHNDAEFIIHVPVWTITSLPDSSEVTEISIRLQGYNTVLSMDTDIFKDFFEVYPVETFL